MAYNFENGDLIQTLKNVFNLLTGHHHGGTNSRKLGSGALSSVTHTYGSAHADWTLTAAEADAVILKVTNADAGANALLPVGLDRVHIVYNTSGQAITFKVTGQTGVAVANGKCAMILGTATDYVRLTADA